MIKYCLFLFTLLCVFITPVYAEQDIFFKIVHDGKQLSFFDKGEFPVPPMVISIADRMMRHAFIPPEKSSKYYKITTVNNVIWQGRIMQQYDYIPTKHDRFRHVLWVDNSTEAVVKMEIFDNQGLMIYSAVAMENFKVAQNPLYKQPLEQNKDFFGFFLISRMTLPDKSEHFLFSDGLNRFSIFIDSCSTEKNGWTEKTIAYGNYITSKCLDTVQYTVVGTIPYDRMIAAIDYIISNYSDKNTLKK